MISNIFHKKYSNYHYCIVRECKNTSIKTPEKLWIKVPSDVDIRNTWLTLAKRDPLSVSTETQIYFCEDHFNLENDMENYMEYKVMGSVKKIRMKPDCRPSRFECQSKRKFDHTLTLDEDLSNKRLCVNVQSTSFFSPELLNEVNIVPSCSSLDNKLDKAVQVVQHNIQFCDKAVQAQPEYQTVACQVEKHYANKITQVSITKQYRSKQIQFGKAVKDAISSPIKPVAHHQFTATSPSYKPSISGLSLPKRKVLFPSEEKYDSDISYTPSLVGSSLDSSPSKVSSQATEVSSEQRKIKIKQKLNLDSTLNMIKQKPRLYIGIPKKLYFIIDIISKQTKLSEKHILLCLMKIRLNRTFSELADTFDISLSQVSKIFINKMPVIVSVLSPFVKTFTKRTIKKKLPIAFRHKYNRVNCIIDCLEIEIQKPKKAIYQALTWSEYKKANTIKYLIACTPDGLVSFISAGYGGRISDINLLEDSKFLDSLEPQSCILADRGFKHIETTLNQKGFTLLRPPSVPVGTKLTKQQVKQTKEIASLRIHVERVIRRVREFSMLKPHSVVNLNLLGVLDFCVITACALVNLQDSLIK